MSRDALLCFLLLCAFFLGLHGNEQRCPTTDCNGVTISYPFWKTEDGSTTNGSSPNVHCGYPGFGLGCPDNSTYPILTLPPDSYHVRHIDYSARSITLVGINVEGKACPRVQHNVTIDKLTFHYNKDNENITFYFNCSFGTSKPPVSPITCTPEYSGNNSYVVLDGTKAAMGFDWTVGRCEEVVVAAVQETRVSESGLVNQFAGAMNAGFVLNWYRTEDCDKCESTDGHCSFNNRTMEFMCYCNDGTFHTNRSASIYCKGKNNVKVKVLIGIAAGGGTALILTVAFFLFLRYSNGRKSGHSYAVSRSTSSAFSPRTDFEKGGQYCGLPIFNYEELRDATNNFDPQRQLGDGGYGTVFYGKLRDGRAVAVKRLYESNYRRAEQFMNEVKILSQLRHPNLVILYGCTSRQSHRLLLVYEYVPNGTVADHLHGDLAKPGSLPWCTRLNIAIETATALVYLHATDIIHRDVKTSNILLDENFSVKVADFGISRLFPFNVTHVSTTPQGTPGYLDPQYHQCYQLTDKSDVYSFGVVLMELISSLPAVDITREGNDINLSTMAIDKIRDHTLCDLVDPDLGFDSNCDTRKMMMAVAELGFQCLQNIKEMRPSMDEVLQTLKDIQKQGSDEDKIAEENDVAVLLKAKQSMHSPVSVMAKFTSTSTTPNASG